MSDVRKMTKQKPFPWQVEKHSWEYLLQQAWNPRDGGSFPHLHHQRIFTEIARRFRVMEEYCEAADAIIFDNNCGVVPHDFFPRRDAYRAMKEERDAD